MLSEDNMLLQILFFAEKLVLTKVGYGYVGTQLSEISPNVKCVLHVFYKCLNSN